MDAKAEAPILWPPEAKCWLIGKDPVLGAIEGTRRRGRQRRWLDAITDLMDIAPGDGEGQGSLACCRPWGRRVGHDRVTEQQQQCYEIWISSCIDLSMCLGWVSVQGRWCLCISYRLMPENISIKALAIAGISIGWIFNWNPAYLKINEQCTAWKTC